MTSPSPLRYMRSNNYNDDKKNSVFVLLKPLNHDCAHENLEDGERFINLFPAANLRADEEEAIVSEKKSKKSTKEKTKASGKIFSEIRIIRE